MREQKSIYRMTDRELRAYKRQQKRRKQIQRRIYTMIATICMIVVCAVSFHGIRSVASNGENQLKFKYYTQVTVAYGETLWDLSDSYIRFLYKGIIIKHNKTEPTYTKTSLFLCEKRRFFMARTEKGVVTTI